METTAKQEEISALRKAINLIDPVSENEFNRLAPLFYRKKFSKGKALFSEGETSRCIYFLLKGCVRSYSLENGKEVNIKFYFEHSAVSDFYSLRNEKPSMFHFVAMEPCITLCIMKKDFFPLIQQSKHFVKFAFRFFQNLYLNEQEHANSFKLMTPEQRYTFIEQNNTHYLQRIPLTHLASYLGTSRETINRIRKKKVEFVSSDTQ